ncbi:tRNA (adenosine(37)-N6)-threonylcarbamoyltransferase complex dimerization subunit type 1 TsaB [bacterium]|nr:tRNA (adenosine(37)-N6)-threonylcarbamoyltransferase complex dimerization subunit type 1 TsaB [bacterium]
MIVLGIETSGPRGGVSLLDSEGRAEERRFDSQRSLGAELAPAIQGLLDRWKLGPERPPDLVAVDLGPGSYTGLRVGLAAGKGLAFAWGRPLVGVRLVEALSRQAPPSRRILCALDAQRGEVYHCIFERLPGERSPSLVIAPQLSEPLALAQALAAETDLCVIGDAASAVERALAGKALRRAPDDLAWPSPRLVAEMGRELHLAGHRDDAISLSPLYLRPSEAEERRRKRERAKGT